MRGCVGSGICEITGVDGVIIWDISGADTSRSMSGISLCNSSSIYSKRVL